MVSDNPLSGIGDGSTLAQAIVDTVREPLLVLDAKLRVVAASGSYYRVFKVGHLETQGRMIYDLANGQWDIPALRELLETIIPQQAVMEAFEVSEDFPGLGPRTMLLNARRVVDESNKQTTLLLAIEDVTERRNLEREKDALLREKDLVLQEMQHRINNSLQIIASILLLKAKAVRSDETRAHLQDAHRRVISVASVQRLLQPSGFGAAIEVSPYLSQLCASLSQSMNTEGQPLSIEVAGNGGSVTSAKAVSIGLITTELVINAFKHAFVGRKTGHVLVSYGVEGKAWRLSVEDDGVGRSSGKVRGPGGLGTSIVEVLARQLEGQVAISSSASGSTVSVAGST